MINLQYIDETHQSHKEVIELMKTGDCYRYGTQCPKDESKAFSLYSEVEGILESFEGRCAGLSPYIHMRMCECYLLGIGTEKDLINAFDSLIRFSHYVHCLPSVARICNIQVDPNLQELEAFKKELLLKINKEFDAYGFFIYWNESSFQVFSKYQLVFQSNPSEQTKQQLLKKVIHRAFSYFFFPLGKKPLYARYGATDSNDSISNLEEILVCNLGFEDSVLKEFSTNINFSTIPKHEIINKQSSLCITDDYCHLYEYSSNPTN